MLTFSNFEKQFFIVLCVLVFGEQSKAEKKEIPVVKKATDGGKELKEVTSSHDDGDDVDDDVDLVLVSE